MYIEDLIEQFPREHVQLGLDETFSYGGATGKDVEIYWMLCQLQKKINEQEDKICNLESKIYDN